MRSPCVRLILKGQTLAEIPFDGETLRIGRMKENDVVIHNLSVSRFHATLTREGDTFVIQDSGSENGIYVNGERQARAVVGPEDRIQIGKHELQIRLDGAAEGAEPAATGGSDAWDASNTYFVGVDTQAKMLGVAHDADTDGEPFQHEEVEGDLATEEVEGELATVAVEAEVEPETRLAEPAALPPVSPELLAEADEEPETSLVAAEPEPESGLLGAEVPDASALLEATGEEPETVVIASDPDSEEVLADEPVDRDDLFGKLDEGDPLPAPSASPEDDDLQQDPTREYDVGAADLEAAEAIPVAEAADDAPAEDVAPAPVSADASGGVHAGLIITRRGRFERVLRWEAERLCLGRAVECDVVLSAAEVSRNHTLLVRDGDRYEVRDLESINGTWVNGEKVSRRDLEVGDVIRIDEFELTFVLEDRPIGDEIVAQAPEEIHAVPSGDAKAFTQLGEMLDLAPFAVGGSEPAGEAAAMSFDDPPTGEPPTLLLEDDTANGEPEAKPDAEGVWRLELKIRLEELPAPLREALRTLEESELRLPVELTLKTDG